MQHKLLVIIPHVMPTTEIALRTMRHALPPDSIRVVEQKQLNLNDIFSGEYKLMFMRQHEPSLKPLIDLIIKKKIPYLYYIDDNFWEVPNNRPIARTYKNKLVIKTYNTFVKNAFCVITPSEFLTHYIKQFTKNVIYIPAAFDFDMLNMVVQKKKTSVINILYSGTLYRETDFDCLIPALKRIATTYNGRVNIHFNGLVLNALKSTKHIFFDNKFQPYEEHIKNQYIINYDIGIAPLADTIFNRSKSHLKYREYSACGIAGAYTDIPPYSDCVIDKETGILVKNGENEWYHSLVQLIEDETLRNKIVTNAREDILKKYTHDVIAPLWSDILNQLPTNANKQSFIDVTYVNCKSNINNMVFNFQRLINYFRYDGTLFVLKKIYSTLFL